MTQIMDPAPPQELQIAAHLRALSLAGAGPEQVRILAFHGGGGVGGTPEMLMPFGRLLVQQSGVRVIAASYRTLAQGPATLRQMLSDAATALAWCRADMAPGGRLFLFGASFGGLLALDAARNSPDGIAGLALMNPVTDIAPGGFTNRVVPARGHPFLSPQRRYRRWRGKTRMRCLIAHGTKDDVVPIDSSRRFAALWPEGQCHLEEYPGAAHGFFNRGPHDHAVARSVHQFCGM